MEEKIEIIINGKWYRYNLPNGLIIKINANNDRVFVCFEIQGKQDIIGNANKAIRRKLARHCYRIHLICSYAGCDEVAIDIYSRRDWHRLRDVIQYVSGRKFAAAAFNNNGKNTTNERKDWYYEY